MKMKKLIKAVALSLCLTMAVPVVAPSVGIETVEAATKVKLNYTKKTIKKGDSIKLKGYMTIYPQLYKSKQIKNVADQSIVNIPARYKAKIKTGTKLNNACKNLSKEGE